MITEAQIKQQESTAYVDNTIEPTRHRLLFTKKIQQIAQLIQDTDEWNRFKQAEDKIEHHGDAQALLFVVKAKRNKFSQVSLRLGYDHPEAIQAKLDYEEVLAQMEKIPLIEQYQAFQEDLNELVQGVLATVMASLSATIPVEQGEAAAQGGGCGSGGCGGSCGRH